MTDERLTYLFDVMASVNGPAKLSAEGIQTRLGDRQSWQIRAGQVWRASGDGVTTLVYVTEVANGSVEAAPVTLGTHSASAGSAIVGADVTAFADSVAVWLPATRSLGWGALDGLLDDWAGPVARWLPRVDQLGAPPGCRVEARDAPLLSSVWDQLAESTADLDELAAQFPIPMPLETVPPTDVALAGLKPSQLARWLNISVADAQNLRRGFVDPSPEQLATIAHATGSPVLPASTVPWEALVAASHPHYRDAVDTLGQRWNLGPAATQRRLAQGAYALAARQSGGAQGVWPARIDAFIESELSAPPGAG